MAWARRCALGCETWPDELLYKKCPVCGEETGRFSNADGYEIVDEETALSLKAHAEFEEFYERRCRDRGVPTDGPLPEHYVRTFKVPA